MDQISRVKCHVSTAYLLAEKAQATDLVYVSKHFAEQAEATQTFQRSCKPPNSFL